LQALQYNQDLSIEWGVAILFSLASIVPPFLPQKWAAMTPSSLGFVASIIVLLGSSEVRGTAISRWLSEHQISMSDGGTWPAVLSKSINRRTTHT